MNRKLKAQWVKALRSGEYEQMAPALCYQEGGKYCCLGVLAAVAGQQGSQLRPWLTEIGLDFESIDGFITMNDGGVPFEVIAGLIREAL